eukprot:159813_1
MVERFVGFEAYAKHSLSTCNVDKQIIPDDPVIQPMSCTKSRIDECVTLGYIRGMERYIPNDVTHIILQYYMVTDEWDAEAKSKSIVISNNAKGSCIQNIGKDLVKDLMQTVLGKTVITNGKHEWCFHIVAAPKQPRDHMTTLIGIQTIDSLIVVDRAFVEEDSTGYGLLGGTCKTTGANSMIVTRFFEQLLHEHVYPNRDNPSHYGCEFGKLGDTIKMSLDMNNCTVSYTINDVAYGSAFDIDATKQYRLAVSLDPGVKIEML